MASAARDAQEKMPKYQLVAAEKGPEEFAKISGLIQLVSNQYGGIPILVADSSVHGYPYHISAC